MTILAQTMRETQYQPILKPEGKTNKLQARCHLCNMWMRPGQGKGYTYLMISQHDGAPLYQGEKTHYLCPACQDRYEQDLSEEARRTLGIYSQDDECTCRPDSDLACPACSRMFGKVSEDGFPF